MLPPPATAGTLGADSAGTIAPQGISSSIGILNSIDYDNFVLNSRSNPAFSVSDILQHELFGDKGGTGYGTATQTLTTLQQSSGRTQTVGEPAPHNVIRLYHIGSKQGISNPSITVDMGVYPVAYTGTGNSAPKMVYSGNSSLSGSLKYGKTIALPVANSGATTAQQTIQCANNLSYSAACISTSYVGSQYVAVSIKPSDLSLTDAQILASTRASGIVSGNGQASDDQAALEFYHGAAISNRSLTQRVTFNGNNSAKLTIAPDRNVDMNSPTAPCHGYYPFGVGAGGTLTLPDVTPAPAPTPPPAPKISTVYVHWMNYNNRDTSNAANAIENTAMLEAYQGNAGTQLAGQLRWTLPAGGYVTNTSPGITSNANGTFSINVTYDANGGATNYYVWYADIPTRIVTHIHNRIVKFQYANGTTAKPDQTLTDKQTRTFKQTPTTGAISDDAGWAVDPTSTGMQITAPAIPGYTASQSAAPGAPDLSAYEHADHTYTDTVTVTYTPDPQTITVHTVRVPCYTNPGDEQSGKPCDAKPASGTTWQPNDGTETGSQSFTHLTDEAAGDTISQTVKYNGDDHAAGWSDQLDGVQDIKDSNNKPISDGTGAWHYHLNLVHTPAGGVEAYLYLQANPYTIDTKTTSRTVKYRYSDGREASTDQTQSTTWQRKVIVNVDHGNKKSYRNWSKNGDTTTLKDDFPAIATPAIAGYTPDTKNVPAIAGFDHDGNNAATGSPSNAATNFPTANPDGSGSRSTIVTVTYTGNPQKLKVVFLKFDNDHTPTVLDGACIKDKTDPNFNGCMGEVAAYSQTFTGPSNSPATGTLDRTMSVGSSDWVFATTDGIKQGQPVGPKLTISFTLDTTYDTDDNTDQVEYVYMKNNRQIHYADKTTTRTVHHQYADGSQAKPDTIQTVYWSQDQFTNDYPGYAGQPTLKYNWVLDKTKTDPALVTTAGQVSMPAVDTTMTDYTTSPRTVDSIDIITHDDPRFTPGTPTVPGDPTTASRTQEVTVIYHRAVKALPFTGTTLTALGLIAGGILLAGVLITISHLLKKRQNRIK